MPPTKFAFTDNQNEEALIENEIDQNDSYNNLFKELHVIKRKCQPSHQEDGQQEEDQQVPLYLFKHVSADVMNMTLNEELACCLRPCFGAFWESIFYFLKFKRPIIDIYLSDAEMDKNRAATNMLMDWVQKHKSSEVMIQALVKVLIKVHDKRVTKIDWETLKDLPLT